MRGRAGCGGAVVNDAEMSICVCGGVRKQVSTKIAVRDSAGGDDNRATTLRTSYTTLAYILGTMSLTDVVGPTYAARYVHSGPTLL